MRSEHDGAVLSFSGLTVRYGKTTAVENVSLSVGRGEVYALLGRNGSGKTSMIRCLLGEWRSASGSASLFGRDAWTSRIAAMERVGVVPEAPDMPPALTVRELSAFCSRLYPRWDTKGTTERLERFRVPQGVAFGRLSRGQKNQAALALALGPAPELLVLDDPTLGLDAVARMELFEELVGDLADRGTTVFITTHDLAGIEGIASRVGILNRGQLLLDEEMETLKGRFRAVRWPGEATPEALSALCPLWVKRDAFGSEAVVGAYDDERYAPFVQELAPATAEVVPLSLEDLFIALVGEEGGRS